MGSTQVQPRNISQEMLGQLTVRTCGNNVTRDQVRLGDPFTCRVVEEQLTQSVMSRISNFGLFFKTGVRRSSVSQSWLCMTRDLRLVEA